MIKTIIKNTSTFFSHFLLLSIIIFQSCTTNNSNENSDSLLTNFPNEISTESKTELNKSDLSSLILLTESGKERFGFLDKTLDEILTEEASEVVDSASNYKGFTKYFYNSDEEFVDIQYFNNGERVTGINLDVYLNSEQEVDNLFNELAIIFKKKYGKPAILEKEFQWKTVHQFVKLKNVSLKLAPGLQITYSKNSDPLNFE